MPTVGPGQHPHTHGKDQIGAAGALRHVMSGQRWL
jgi:hypothetical protein